MIRAFFVACAVPLTAASPAVATTFNGRADVGPAIAGDTVIWSQGYSNGSGALKQDGRVIARWDAPTGEVFLRRISAIGASPTRVTYAMDDYTQEDDAANTTTTATTSVPLLSTGGGPFTSPFPGCRAESIMTAVDGDNVAFALSYAEAPCGGGVYVNGRKIAEADGASQLRLAGAYVAWMDGGPYLGGNGRISVADVNSGATLATFVVRNKPWGPFDIDAQGNIVAVRDGQLLAFTVTNPARRVLSRRATEYAVATAGGRVAYIDAKRNAPRSLVLTDRTGKVL
jgi:hypothetical protein